MNKEEIDNMRNTMQTKPARSEKIYNYDNALNHVNVNLVSYSKNPFKDILTIACSTWGDGNPALGFGSTKKWEKLTPQNRYRIVLAALSGNTLPTALEAPTFLFEVNGCPRHTYDQWVRNRFLSVGSIGVRDNDKLNAPFLIYDRLYKLLQEDNKLKDNFEQWLMLTKDLYEKIISNSKGDFQLGRDVLPLSLNHSFTFSSNLLNLKNILAQRMKACEQDSIVLLAWKVRKEIKDKVSPFLSNYMRPSCDYSKKCTYHGGAEGMTKYFSSLFKGCGRWPEEHEYSEFNHSCSDYSTLANHVEIVARDGWINYTEESYDLLSDKDKKLFEEQ